MAPTDRTMEQQLKELQDQVLALTLALNQCHDRSPRCYKPEDEDGYDYSSDDETNVFGRRHTGSSSHSDIKVDIPEYDGRIDPDEFVEWLRTVERVFDYKQTTEDKKVKIVALKLRKYASTWWANVCSKRERQGKSKVREWRKMKKLLKEKFMPAYYIQESFSKLHFLKQGGRSVEAYSQDFEYLIMKCDLDEDDPQTLVRYLGGLEPRIANVVELQPYSTLVELTLLAHKVDTQQKTRGKTDVEKPVNKQHDTSTVSAGNSLVANPSKAIELPESSNAVTRTPRRCFRCHGFGHIASECPNKRIVTLTTEFQNCENPLYDTEPKTECCKQEEEIEVGPDDGDCLVVRRTLTGTTVEEETRQRETIFRTRCTVLNKVCSLVIDGGSCTNVASQTLITKLKFPVEPHPFPYDIQWLSQGRGIRVTNRILLSFTIGAEYQDEVWCDIIPMDACHLLLGRPWLYDRQVVHDGYKNTYSFVKDRKNITLLPMTNASTPSCGSLVTTTLFNWPSENAMKIDEFSQVYSEDLEVHDSGAEFEQEGIRQHIFESSSLRANFFKGEENDSSKNRSTMDLILDKMELHDEG